MAGPIRPQALTEDVSLRPWMAKAEELALVLGSDLTAGLTADEARRRLAADGPNDIRSTTGSHPLVLFVAQFRSVVIWVLMAASVTSALLGETADAIAIAAIVFLNAMIGFYQEYRAERAVAALRRLTAPRARVVRDGRTRVVPAAEVVRGDLLVLEAGDLVAADARLVEAASLRTNEAPLTGESEPVDKDAAPLPEAEVPLGDRRNMVYLGTSVVRGSGRALVVATGMRTEFGRIARLLESAGEGETPLQRRLDRVGQHLLVASLSIVVLVFLLGLLRGEARGEMFLTAISLAVAAIPEGLPAVVTVALALGVSRMVRRNVLVRRLPAIETLGSTQVICSDKTGTLTVGEMTVRALWVGGRELRVNGEGYSTHGEFRDGTHVANPERDPALHATLFAAAACNDAELWNDSERAKVLGDPTEVALLVAAAKAGIFRSRIEEEYPRLRTLPFDSERKRMTVVRSTPEGPRAFVKGAPDVLLTRCERWLGADGAERPLTDAERSMVVAANHSLASQGLRVLAVASRSLTDADFQQMEPDAIECDLTLAGLLAMYDPPRPEAKDAVRRCRQAGIRTVMITGDHPATAAAVASELGILGEHDEVVPGTELQPMTEEELRGRVIRIAVYARVTAEDKLRIVRAFRASGIVVAMTGDGVNDAPAVKEASVGVAMGRAGTEVTKEAADIVVTDDNFASIVAAVEEGRGIYDNIKKCLHYLLAGNTAEVLVVLTAVLLGWPIPLLPLQILWINLVTDGLPALALTTDPVSADVMERPPRPPDEQLADRYFLRSILLTGALTAAVGIVAFYDGLRIRGDLTTARDYAFTALVYGELLRSLGARSRTYPFWSPQGLPNPRLAAVVAGSILVHVMIHHTPPLKELFGLAPISVPEGLRLLALGSVPLLVLEIRKTPWFHRRRSPR